MNNNEAINLLTNFVGQTNSISVPKIFVLATGDIRAALMLSQLWFWSKGRIRNLDGWIYKSDREFSMEIGLNEYGVRKAKSILIDLGVIKTDKRMANGSPTTHYKLAYETLLDLLNRTNPFDDVEQNDSTPLTESITNNTTNNTTGLFTSVNKVSSPDETKPKLLPEAEEAYKKGIQLNEFWRKTIGKGAHKSLESKFLTKGKYGGSDRETQPVWAPITSAIRNIGVERLQGAIYNYKKSIEQADQYNLQPDFSFAEFCFNLNYEPYLNGIKEKKKFKSDDPWDEIREEFDPLCSIYNQIFDEKTQRYYGFKKDKINSTIRFEDIQSLMKLTKTTKKHNLQESFDYWTFDAFMELEWMIAGMLWRRQREPQGLELCQEYLNQWKELIPKFKKEAKRWLKEDWELYG